MTHIPRSTASGANLNQAIAALHTTGHPTAWLEAAATPAAKRRQTSTPWSPPSTGLR
jgi:hypothetical protein